MGVVDSEYVFHKGIQTLGGSGHRTTKVFALIWTVLADQNIL